MAKESGEWRGVRKITNDVARAQWTNVNGSLVTRVFVALFIEVFINVFMLPRACVCMYVRFKCVNRAGISLFSFEAFICFSSLHFPRHNNSTFSPTHGTWSHFFPLSLTLSLCVAECVCQLKVSCNRQKKKSSKIMLVKAKHEPDRERKKKHFISFKNIKRWFLWRIHSIVRTFPLIYWLVSTFCIWINDFVQYYISFHYSLLLLPLLPYRLRSCEMRGFSHFTFL